jgi:hypothetical protein
MKYTVIIARMIMTYISSRKSSDTPNHYFFVIFLSSLYTFSFFLFPCFIKHSVGSLLNFFSIELYDG